MKILQGMFTRVGPRGLALIASLLCGAIAAVLADRHMSSRLEELERQRFPEQSFVEVVVADRDLEAGDTLTQKTVSVMKLPSRWIHPDLLQAERFMEVADRAVNRSIQRGIPIGHRDLIDANKGGSLSDLPPGHRLLSVTDLSGVSDAVAVSPRVQVDVWEQLPAEPGAGLVDRGNGFSVQAPSNAFSGPQARLLVRGASLVQLGGAGKGRTGREGDAVFLALPEEKVGLFVAAKARGALTISLVSPSARDAQQSVPDQTRKGVERRDIEVIVHANQGGLR